MERFQLRNALAFGFCAIIAFAILGYFLRDAAIAVKEYERTVTAKGLAEREVPADIVIWPVSFTLASNSLDELYASLEQNTQSVRDYLLARGINAADISANAPVITDKSAQSYGGPDAPFRYVATAVVTVYSHDINTVRGAMQGLAELGKKGIVLTAGNYDSQTQYLFTGLNDIKPAMIEQATINAREVANKFAADSGSRLGKIKRASQGQFSINPRDANNPHIKKVRVVSTVEYYLAD
ncbi:SIMPL domain-containing protein [Gilvimarinus sp. DA14]|uniref:SIMPL domain-containing protein n=1 Tax=Gilvimarinus sp. DA14 TaxID=2956798 RepID=UPI0020B85B21|nr:SIMPL domain-containing protein [Gilvimarinus sp. DA14]UTF58847.1 SIMPL domain-containing protein [Gilvimarinus sp. DA14]